MFFIKKYINKIIYFFIYYFILFYQKIISPMMPARCRYYPTCSAYGMQAIRWHGGLRGAFLLIRRLARCQPFGGHGIDFVPLPLYRYRYDYIPHTPSISQDVSSYTQSYPQHHCVWTDRYSYNKRLANWLR